MAEKLKKIEVKIGEVQKEKIASKLEEVMFRCRRAKVEETYVEYYSCSDAGKDKILVGGMLPVLVFQGC